MGSHKLERYATYVFGTIKEHKFWKYRSICIHRKYFHLHLEHIIKQFKLFYMSSDRNFKPRSKDIECHEKFCVFVFSTGF